MNDAIKRLDDEVRLTRLHLKAAMARAMAAEVLVGKLNEKASTLRDFETAVLTEASTTISKIITALAEAR